MSWRDKIYWIDSKRSVGSNLFLSKLRADNLRGQFYFGRVKKRKLRGNTKINFNKRK